MVHDNPESVEQDELKELLLVVRDVLWVCDYYPGGKEIVLDLRLHSCSSISLCPMLALLTPTISLILAETYSYMEKRAV
jgi:hypothetical protein